MNIVDLVIIAILCFTTIRGIFRGLSSELASIIGVMGAFYAAFLFYPQVAEMLPHHIPPGTVADVISFALIFLAVFVTISILGMLVKFALGIVMLGWVDRVLGGIFGTLKGVLFVSVLLFLITTVGSSSIPAVERSTLCKYTGIFAEGMADAVPEEMPRSFSDLVPDELKNRIKKIKERIWR
ncbi:MAG: CvpA family protein [Thermodesulfobacteriota bacterium]|nr:CvpA family protein [Thermodesulfobacteriota bacterium]